jgi:hypothetical protein
VVKLTLPAHARSIESVNVKRSSPFGSVFVRWPGLAASAAQAVMLPIGMLLFEKNCEKPSAATYVGWPGPAVGPTWTVVAQHVPFLSGTLRMVSRLPLRDLPQQQIGACV